MILHDIQCKPTLPKYAIGIDFGTTNCVVAIYHNEQVQYLKIEESDVIPTAIQYTKNDVIIGKNALEKGILNIKSLISNSDLISTYKYEHKIENEDLLLYTCQGWKSCIEIAANIFQFLRFKISKQVNENVHHTVLTVPTRFDDTTKHKIVKAAQQGGWTVTRVLTEPTAALLALHHQKNLKNGIYGVYDLGGGTFDFSVVKIYNEICHVLSTSGDTQLGGNTFDIELQKHHSYTIQKIQKLRENEKLQVQNAQFITSQTVVIMNKALADANISICDLHGIILTGGASQIQCIQDTVKSLHSNIIYGDAMKNVAYGAALQSHKLLHSAEHLLLDATPLSIGIESLNQEIEWMITKNTVIPTFATQIFTRAHPQQTSIKFNIVQGEEALLCKCISLGKFEIPIQPGDVSIEVKFLVDENNMLSVTATNLDDGKKYTLLASITKPLTLKKIFSLQQNS